MTQAARLGVGLLGTANLESAFLLPHLFLAHVIIFEKAIKDVSQPALVRFLRRAGKLAGVTGRVAVLIASNRSVRELNRRFRKKNQPTDVLSFPADRGGDIAIAAGMVRENARRYGHSPSQEIQILILHGLLHLAGYDHETDSGQMATRERRLRARLKLPESLIGRAPSRSPCPARRDQEIVVNRLMVYLAIFVLCGLLALVSYVEQLYTESGKFLAREFQENIEAFEKFVEPRLVSTSRRAWLAMAVLAQLCTAAIALLIGYLVFLDQKWTAGEILQAAVGIILVVIVCNRLAPYLMFTRTRGLWLIRLVPLLQALIYAMVVITIPLNFSLSVAALAKPHEPEEPENASEAVDALIEAGREEGILEESDRQLIQSVVEFGDKTVREVMTPRPEIFAVAADATIAEFAALLKEKPHTRVPLYASSIDHILGMALSHDLIQIPGDRAKTTAVRTLVRPVIFVPETKKTSQLLREMQRDNVHMAIVIDEYGSVAGLVTMEDLVEEIVGEIGDEHEDATDIVREGESAYVMQGNVDVGRLQDLFHLHFEPRDTATVAGLVSAFAGRIPQPGEIIEKEGLRFEVLASTDRKVERVRVSRARRQSPAREVSS